MQRKYGFKNSPCRSNNLTIEGKKCQTDRVGGLRLEEFDFAANESHIMNKVSLTAEGQILIDTSGLPEGDNLVDLVAYTAGNVEAFLHFNVRISVLYTNYAPSFGVEELEGFLVEISEEGDTAVTTWLSPIAEDTEGNEIFFEVLAPNYPFLSWERVAETVAIYVDHALVTPQDHQKELSISITLSDLESTTGTNMYTVNGRINWLVPPKPVVEEVKPEVVIEEVEPIVIPPPKKEA